MNGCGVRAMRGFLFGLLLSAAGATSAHRGQDVLTVVEIDGTTGEVHATHHFAAHDIEPVLPTLAPDVPANLDDADAKAAFITYLNGQFALTTDQGPVTLQLIDLQLAGDDVRAHYRGQLPAKTNQLEIHSNLVANLARDSTHQVNIRRLGVTRTLVFESGDDSASIEMDN